MGNDSIKTFPQDLDQALALVYVSRLQGEMTPEELYNYYRDAYDRIKK
jgi:hypothetical protein